MNFFQLLYKFKINKPINGWWHWLAWAFLFAGKVYCSLLLLAFPVLITFSPDLSLIYPFKNNLNHENYYPKQILFPHCIRNELSPSCFLIMNSSSHPIDIYGLFVKLFFVHFFHFFYIQFFLHLLFNPLSLELCLVPLALIEWWILSFKKGAPREVSSLLKVRMLPVECLFCTFH